VPSGVDARPLDAERGRLASSDDSADARERQIDSVSSSFGDGREVEGRELKEFDAGIELVVAPRGSTGLSVRDRLCEDVLDKDPSSASTGDVMDSLSPSSSGALSTKTLSSIEPSREFLVGVPLDAGDPLSRSLEREIRRGMELPRDRSSRLAVLPTTSGLRGRGGGVAVCLLP